MREHARSASLVFVLALLVRLWFVLEVHPPGQYIMSDMALYDGIAERLRTGASTASDTFLPVGYPAMLALFHAIGASYVAVGVAHAILGSLTASLAYALAWTSTKSKHVAVLAGAIVALHPILIFYCGFLLTETLFAALLAAFAFAFARALERPKIARFVVAGLFFGLATIVRSNMLACAITIGIALVPILTRSARVRKGALAMGAMALAVVAIPCARNTMLLGHLAGPSTNGGVNFFLGHAPYSGVIFHEGDPIGGTSVAYNRAHFSQPFVTDLHAYDSSAFFSLGLRELAHHPWRLLDPGPLLEGLGFVPPRAWPDQSYWPGFMGHHSELAIAHVVTAALVAIACATLVWMLWRRRVPRTHLGTVALALGILVTLQGFGHARVRASFDPVLAVLAADGLVRTWHRVAKSGYVRSRRATR